MKFLVLLFLLIFTYVIVFAEADSTQVKCDNSDKASLIFSAGISYQREFLGEVGLIYGLADGGGPCFGPSLAGVKIASEFNFDPENFYIAPKICGVLSTFPIGIRLSVIDYTDLKYHDIKITPEIGISVAAIDIFYGYNYSLTDRRIENIGTHRITTTFNFSRYFF
jgi:hypothetical protein